MQRSESRVRTVRGASGSTTFVGSRHVGRTVRGAVTPSSLTLVENPEARARLWCTRRELVLDLLPVAVLLGLTVAFVASGDVPRDAKGVFDRFVDTALMLLLLVRRRWPVALMALLTGVAVAMLVLNYLVPGTVLPVYEEINPWLPLAICVGSYTVAAYAPHRPVSWVLVIVALVVGARPWDPVVNAVSGAVLLTAVPALLGLYFGVRRRLEQALRDRAERAEREQHLRAETARAEERARLASEMHDVVSHRVSLMVLQAGALGVTARDEPTRAAAEELRAAGCQALDELRDLLGVLRTDPGDDDRELDERDGSVLDLSGLVEESESVGVPVDLVEEGNAARVSPVVARTAYRIVREALTNVRKHATGAGAHVHLRYGGDRVRLSVRNTPPTDEPDAELVASGSGTGLLGLRQRVELVGGTIDARPENDGGFIVDAILPAYVPTREA